MPGQEHDILYGLGVLVGLEEEARIMRRFFPSLPIALSHAQEVGAKRALDRLQQVGVSRLLSFGCAGGLAPSVAPGTVLVADYVCDEGVRFTTDEALSCFFGAGRALRGGVLHQAVMVAKAEDKSRLYHDTGCLAVDMESGLVARSGLPFAVLRVVCDDAARDLPSAAAEALKEGKVHLPALLTSLMRDPGQIGALVSLGCDAAKARHAMKDFLEAL